MSRVIWYTGSKDIVYTLHIVYYRRCGCVHPPAPDKSGFSAQKNRNGATPVPITAIPHNKDTCAAGTLAKRYLRRRRFPRKRSHSRRLFGCKRPHNAFGSLPTFCEAAPAAQISLWFAFPTAVQEIACSVLFYRITVQFNKRIVTHVICS